MTEALVLLTTPGCSRTAAMRAQLEEALSRSPCPRTYTVLDLSTLPPADRRRGFPTPTLLYQGADLFGLPAPDRPLPAPT